MKPAKAFDCVAMKHGAQAQLQAGYEARSSEFSSYADFITKTADEDPWILAFKERIRAQK
jgi:hypothetical protein